MKKKCIHCGEEILINHDKFCCTGCEKAFEIVNNLGFKNYYQMRQINQKEAKLKPDENTQNFDLAKFVKKNSDNNYSISLMVQGLHCAACVWLIENILKGQKNVTNARINLSRRNLNLSWQGTLQDGNKLISLVQQIGYKILPFDEEILKIEEKKYSNSILLALAVAGFGAGNVMLLSFSLWFSNIFDMPEQVRNLLHFFTSLIALPVVVFSGRIFFISAFKSIRAKSANMDVAISLAILLSCLVSLIQTFKGSQHVYFDSAIMLTFFLLIGRYLEFSVKKKAFNIASNFNLLAANFVRIIDGKKVKIISTSKLKKDMILLVSAGEKIAGDGVIIDGNSEVDFSIINGESLPKEVVKNSEVFAGTINLSNLIKVRITRNPKQSLLAQIVKMSEEVENNKSSYVKISDSLARIYLPLVHAISAATFIFYLLKTNFDIAMSNAIAVLIITCPCALALAVPIVQVIAISKLIKKGILVKSGQALEKLRQVQTVIFDKTGSLTLGKLQLINLFLIEDGALKKLSKKDQKYFLQIAASMAKASKHPISSAILRNFSGSLIDLKIKEIAGSGLQSKLDGKMLKLGKKSFCKIANFKQNFSAKNVKLFLKFGSKEILFLLEDEIKQDAKEVVKSLKIMGKKIILLSGDEEDPVKFVAQKLGIKQFYFGKNPKEKMQILHDLKAKNKKFIMVGDGLNDAPSLAMSDISISFSSAANLSQNIADIIIRGDNLAPIIKLLQSSKKAIRLMKQNLMISLFYNLVAIPFAILGHIVPLFAALAMSCSSILVLLNSLRMNRD